MHKLALTAVLASCGLPYEPLDNPPPPVPSDAGIDADAPAVIAAPLPTARRPLDVHAMHGDRLRALAVTEDGAMAVSSDVRGSLRWWPSLDGKHEPIVIPARDATALAVTHDGDGGVFAALDGVGQLEIVRMGPAGDVRASATPELARPAVEIRAVGAVFLVRCDDGAIVRIAADGRRTGELRPAPHQHVTALAARRGAVLAIVDIDDEMHGRWLDPAKMKWGELTPAMDIDGTHVELSPGHRTIAATTGAAENIDVVDLANGWRVATPVAQTFVDPMLRPVGFQTDDALAVISGGSAMWADKTSAVASGLAAITDAGMVVETEGGFVLQDATTAHTAYLGYQLSTPVYVHALAGGGWLATDGRTVARIDEHLHTARAYDLPELPAYPYGFSDVRPIDDHNVIGVAYGHATPDIYVVQLERGRATYVGSAQSIVDYDAARRVLVYRRGGEFVFAQYDAKTETFGATGSVTFSGNSAVIHLLDPAKTHDLAVVVDASYAYDVATTATITRVKAIRGDGELALGKMREVKLPRSWWRNNGSVDALAGPDALPVAAAIVRPRPDGKLVARLAGDRITLEDVHGTERWTAAAAGATNLVWSDDGVLAAFGSGMARMDVATGEVSALQCGWRFGLWPKPLAISASAAMCEQSWTATE